MTTTDRVDEIVDQWALARPDLDVSPMQVIGRISRLSRVLDDRLAPVFANHGLGEGEFDVLATLRRAGGTEGLSPTELGSSMMVTSGAVSKRVDRLVAAGLVHRLPRADDGRGRSVRLTDQGADVVDQAVEAHVSNERILLAGLTPVQQDRLADLLRTLALSLTQD